MRRCPTRSEGIATHPLTAYVDLDEVLRKAVPYAAASVGAEGGSLVLHDSEARELVVGGRRYPDSAGVAGVVLRSGRPCIVSKPRHEVDQAAGLEPRSLMAAPLTVDGRTLGVMLAVNKGDGGAFEQDDLERFASCCGLIAVAIENASLYRLLDASAAPRGESGRPRLIAESPSMRRALAQAERVAAGRSSVLLIGETGSGKEQLARRIHELSPRSAGPFVALNCGALPEGLLESELFGHEKGAFTGADRRRAGRFELASGGTLFLDEIGELPPAAQVKLLRVLQEREIQRVGGSQAVPVDVRLIAATHRDLQADVRAGRFREDLYFRVHVVPVQLPPLRERPEDVLPLARLFLERFARELEKPPRALTAAALERLERHAWPGNVRELENLLERLVVMGERGEIGEQELAGVLGQAAAARPSAGDADASFWDHERRLLADALARAGQNQTHAARLLKISREQLRTRMKRYDLFAR